MISKEQFERDVIRGLLQGLSTKYWMNILTEDTFEIIQMRLIFSGIKGYYKNYNNIPSVDILLNELFKRKNISVDELKNIEAFLKKTEQILDDKFDYAIKHLIQQYESRVLRTTMMESLKLIEKGDTKKAQDVMLSQCLDLSSHGNEVRIIDFAENYEKRKDELIKLRDNPDLAKQNYIPTGIEQLDFELDGGMRNGELFIWLAVPEGGKSISMQDSAMSAAEAGYKVALFTIEMTPEQTAYRLDSRLSQIRYRYFRRNALTDEQISLWKTNVDKIPPNRLKIIGAYEGCSCRLIESELNKMKHYFRPDLVIVDYAGIMSPNEGGYGSSMDWQYIGAVVKNLKGLALKINIPIVSACQLLVGAKEKDTVTAKDIGLARQQISAHADVAIAILQTSQMRAMDMTKLQLVKVREGAENRFIEITSDYDRISLVRRKPLEEEVPF